MGTISVEEAIWTLFALPGLYLWVRSAVDAQKTMRAVKSKRIVDGRRTVARLATALTRTMIMVDAVFVGVGVLGMTRIPNPTSTPLSRAAVAVAVVAASVGLTLLAVRWRQAEEYLLRESAQRTLERADLAAAHELQDARGTAQDVRTVAQDARGVGQDVRTVDQDARGVGQDDRSRRQSARGVEQDARGAEQDRRDHPTTEETP